MSDCEASSVDFSSAYTYLPGICLIFWVGAASAFACLFNENQYHLTPYLLVVCYTVNWWTAAQLVPSWDLLPRGVSSWLAWVAYSHIFHDKIAHNPETDPLGNSTSDSWVDWSLFSSTSSLLHTILAGVVSGLATSQAPTLLPVLTAATAILTLFPTRSSSFLHLSCGPRVLKTVMFATLYSFLYTIGPPSPSIRSRHHQAVTMGAVWVLLCTPYALVFLPFQVGFTLLQRGLLPFDGSSDGEDKTKERISGEDETKNAARQKSNAFDQDLEKALSTNGRSTWDTGATVDVARLQQLSNSGK